MHVHVLYKVECTVQQPSTHCRHSIPFNIIVLNNKMQSYINKTHYLKELNLMGDENSFGVVVIHCINTQ